MSAEIKRIGEELAKQGYSFGNVLQGIAENALESGLIPESLNMNTADKLQRISSSGFERNPNSELNSISVNGALLRETRLNLRIRQGTLGKMVGVSTTWISNMERNPDIRVSIETANKLTNALGLSLNELERTIENLE